MTLTIGLLVCLAPLARAQDPPQGPRLVTGTVAFSDEELARILELSPLPDPPRDPTNAVYESEAAARLGQALFYDTRLSGPGTISCATCHDPDRSWTDGKKVGETIKRLPRHTISLWNVAYNRWFFWDGRRDSLWAQALAPLEDPREQGTSRLAIAHLLHDDADYRRAYTEVFGELPDLADSGRFPPEGRPVNDQPEHPHAVAWTGMTFQDRDAVNRVFANVGKAIAAFERKLVSRDAPFDRFVEGLREGDALKQRSLSESARRGLKLFLGRARCHLCHTGPTFTDLEFHNDRVPSQEGGFEQDLGRFRGIDLVQQDPFNGIGRYSDAPEGEAENKVSYLVKNSHNLNEYKTATLRNVAATAPYMHAGQFETLADVIEFYSTFEGAAPPHKGGERLLIPVHLTLEEKRDLQDFLESLTDTGIASELLGPPETPFRADGGN